MADGASEPPTDGARRRLHHVLDRIELNDDGSRLLIGGDSIGELDWRVTMQADQWATVEAQLDGEPIKAICKILADDPAPRMRPWLESLGIAFEYSFYGGADYYHPGDDG